MLKLPNAIIHIHVKIFTKHVLSVKIVAQAVGVSARR